MYRVIQADWQHRKPSLWVVVKVNRLCLGVCYLDSRMQQYEFSPRNLSLMLHHISSSFKGVCSISPYFPFSPHIFHFFESTEPLGDFSIVQ